MDPAAATANALVECTTRVLALDLAILNSATQETISIRAFHMAGEASHRLAGALHDEPGFYLVDEAECILVPNRRDFPTEATDGR